MADAVESRRLIVEGVAPICPWEDPAAALAEVDERIASIRSKLDDESNRLAWWKSVPARVKQQLADDIDRESES